MKTTKNRTLTAEQNQKRMDQIAAIAPMYAHHHQFRQPLRTVINKQNEVVFQGSVSECREFIDNQIVGSQYSIN